jgi:phage terminase small subunit
MKYNPTVKERRFLKAYLEGKSLAESAKYAGSRGKDKDSLKVIGHRMLTNINLSMDEILTLCGLTDEVLAKQLQEGLEAERLYLASFEGKFLDERKSPDVPTRLKAVEMISKMRGHFKDRYELTGKEGGDIVLQVRPVSTKKEPGKIQVDEIED